MKSVRNAIEVLHLFSQDRPFISVSMVSEHLDIPKSSASRLLSAMKSGGIVFQDRKGGRYSVGDLAHKLGHIYGNNKSSRDILRAAMQEVATNCGHSSWSSILTETDITILEEVHGGYPVRFVVETGSKLPAHATAAGKALLARLSDKELEERYANTKNLERYTEHTLPSIPALLEEVDQIRTRGWAESAQEFVQGIKSIGVCFSTFEETGPLAISVSFPMINVGKKGEKAIRFKFLEVAKEYGSKLGDPFWEKIELP